MLMREEDKEEESPREPFSIISGSILTFVSVSFSFIPTLITFNLLVAPLLQF